MRLSKCLLSILLLLYLVIPSLYSPFKLIFLALVACYLKLVNPHKKILFPLFSSIIFYFSLLLPLYLVSIISHEPGAIPIFLTNHMLPLIFYLLLSSLSGILSLKDIISLICFSSPIILFLQVLGYINPTISSLLHARSGTIYDTFTYSGTKSLYFVVPFIACLIVLLLITPHKDFSASKNIYKLYFCLISGEISLFLSFEGTPFGVILISTIPFIYYFINNLLSLMRSCTLSFRNLRFLSLFLVLSGLIFAFSSQQIYSLIFDRLLSFNPSDSGDIIRSMLFKEHLLSIIRSPFFGNGIGYDNGLGRSISSPWASELTFMSSLAQYGLIGIFLLVNYIGLFFIKSLKTVIYHISDFHYRQSFYFLIPYIFGILSSLIAAINNPSLGSAEALFIFLIPVLSYQQNSNLTCRSNSAPRIYD